MADIIPEEVFIIPSIILVLAILTPLLTAPIIFSVLNFLTKKNKTRTISVSILGIVFLFIPLIFLFLDKFQMSIILSSAICLFSSAVGIGFAYFAKK